MVDLVLTTTLAQVLNLVLLDPGDPLSDLVRITHRLPDPVRELRPPPLVSLPQSSSCPALGLAVFGQLKAALKLPD